MLAHLIAITSDGPTAFALNTVGSIALTAIFRNTTLRSARDYIERSK